VVPKLTGKTLPQAKKLLAAAKCRLGKRTSTKSRRVKKGRVAKQSARAGTRLPVGTKVKLVLSRGRR
jgi:beta-lactam-binding protein with PASTA domain